MDVVGDDELLACHPFLHRRLIRAGAYVEVAGACQVVAVMLAEEYHPCLHLDGILLAMAYPMVHDHYCHY